MAGLRRWRLVFAGFLEEWSLLGPAGPAGSIMTVMISLVGRSFKGRALQ